MTQLSEAVALLKAGNAAAAQKLLLKETPASAQHFFLLGACEHAQGHIPQAVRSFTKALEQEPSHAQAACALGSLYAGLGRQAEAEALFRQTLTHTEDAQLRFNLAVVLEDQCRHDEALAEYSQLLQSDNHNYAARHNRAGLLAKLKRLADAARDYRLLVEEYPQQTLPKHNLGEIELALGNYEAASSLLLKVLESEPANDKALLSLAVAQAANAEIRASQQSFRQLKTLAPQRWEEARVRINGKIGNDGDIDPRLLYLIRQQDHMQACNWKSWERFGEIFSDFINAPGYGDTLALAYISMGAPVSPREQLRLTQHISQQVERECTPYLHSPAASPKRLRIAYLATQFGYHVTGLLFRNFFAAHDHQSFEIYVVSLGTPDNSNNLEKIRNTPGIHWVDLSALNDEHIARQLYELNLDIIVDLAVYNDSPRPRVLAHKAAPVQVSWQGAAYSTGARFFDYLISDNISSPTEQWCSEAEARIPDCYFLFSHEEIPPLVPDRTSLGLPDNKFIFSCLNIASKIEPEIFSVWMDILQQCPDSVLWLLAQSSAQVLNIKREAEWRGIDPRRLVFANRVKPEEHIARSGAADLFLDTRLFNGHTTVAETLWAGTPVLTCPGDKFCSRVGASLVKSCGLDELVVSSWPEYRDMAISLYQDRSRLHKLRESLAKNRLLAPSFNMRQQAHHLEKAYRHMRERFAQGLPPAPFNIADLPD
ncbi:MAG: tetratricopeptide repeat protein [Pedobacter sp.]|nr:tetratricopeptide repeat protein [Pedobacter sp.]